MKIAKITGREVLDSRGNPTVEVDVVLESTRLWNSATRTRTAMAARVS